MNEVLLIEGLRQRDKVVFDYLFNYYYSSLCAFSMQYVQDHDIVEDLVQDFFVSLWLEASDLKICSSLRSYLFTGVKNRCIDFRKHQKVIEKYRAHILFSGEDQGTSANHYFAESELRQAIEKGLKKLPSRCREIFEMSRFKGYSNHEIAEHLGISKRTVELQISNALKSLRKELIEFFPIWLVVWLIGS